MGINSSLNLTLARLNSIESNFSALESVASFSSKIQKPIEKAQNNSFGDILKKEIEKKEEIKEQALNEALEILPEEISEEKKEAINLKTKLDLSSQKENIDEIIETFSEKYGMDSSFIKAIIKQESGFNPNATSKKGAMGLMQLMPKTAESLGITDAYNPTQNIEGGIKYLKGLMDRFNGDEKLALAAYNAGPNAVKKYGGIPPYKETQNYVKSIMAMYDKVKGVQL